MSARFAILYEHPQWFRPLFAELHRRGIAFEDWKADSLAWDPGSQELPDLVFNRMSASARWRGNERGQFAVFALLRHLEERGVEVINGSRAYEFEISKSRQMDALRQCGVRAPRTRVVNSRERLAAAAQELRFPVIFKPDCGGAGSGMRRFDSLEQLNKASDALDFGCTHTALLQEYAAPRGGVVYRVEVLDRAVLYATSVEAEGFNLCPADMCATGKRTCVQLPEGMETTAISIARHCGIDAGGVEYLLDARDGQPVFYDINALSNYAIGAEQTIGFDPHARLVDFLARRLEAAARVRR